jgi:phospholipid N-methyltransferase
MERNQHKAEDVLLNTIQKRPDFKEELKELKEIISSVSGKHGAITTLMANGKREFFHKHHCTINQLQNEMNQNVEFIRKSQQMVDYKSAISLYRKKANYIFRKYHMSFREMRDRRLVKVSRNLRWVLERHRNPFSFYRLGLRIYPGKKMWKDPLV